MAVVRAYRGLNMESTKVWKGVVDSYDASSITISAGGLSATYHGNFSYDVYGRVYGQLKGFEQSYEGTTLFEVTGIWANANTVFNYVDDGNARAALAHCLRFADKIYGSTQNDRLLGFDGNDQLFGSNGADVLKGMDGRDALRGGQGSDVFVGGTGADVMDAGKDNNRDTFVFETRRDSGSTGDTRDRIVNFDRGEDKIDLRKLNVDFSARPDGSSVWQNKSDRGVVVHVDVGNDGRSDFSFLVVGVSALSAADFML
jgi:Ca2+-binding RTX toxin-like protein